MRTQPFQSKTRNGFTLVEILIVIAVIGILTAIAVPSFLNSRMQGQAKTCQENQAALSGAIQQWAMSENKSDMPSYDQLVGSEAYLAKTPRCPTTHDPIALPADLKTKTKCPTDEPKHNID